MCCCSGMSIHAAVTCAPPCRAKLEAEEKKRAEREKLFAKMRAEQERVMDKRVRMECGS